MVGVVIVLLFVACTSDGSTDEATNSSTSLPTTSTTTTVPPSTTEPPDTTSTTKAPSGPGYGGVAIIADDQWPPTLNPWTEGGDNFIVSIIAQAWMTGAWDVDATTLEIVPEVVTEIPLTSNGGVVVKEDGTMTVAYSIRDEAVWDDGAPISGADFAFTLEQSLAYEANQEYYSDYTDADIVSTEVGAKTFSMTLRRPTIGYESLFRWLLPQHAIEETAFPDDWLNERWPSGGPFIIETVEPSERITLVRNDNYWKTDATTGLQLPYLDGVEFVFMPETETIVRAFSKRDVDVIQPPPWIKGTIVPLMALEADGADVQVKPGPVWEHINFQFGPGRFGLSENSCNDNLALRRAVMHTIDRDLAVGTYYQGYNRPLTSYVDAYSPTLSHHSWDRYPHDPDTGQDLYQQAVAETGVECSVVFSTTSNGDLRVALADMYADMFSAAGIPFELELMDSALFFGEVLENGTWDLGQWAWVGSPGRSGLVSAHDLFDPNNPPPDGLNYYRWGTDDSSVQDEHTTRFAEVVDEMNATVDDAELTALIAEAEEILADQAVILPLHARLTVGAVWADEIGGYEYNPSQAGHTWNIERWYRIDR